ncbi:hypothetical protein IW140_000780 [Coemansia sp. RSA 1813]|nr:hypothetical protein EV178_000716 [Coemansia sp. RSA 1646]KAJ2092335.1 hypothetical protein IW138_001097 [Coemansia sp. RSA 986]KAJ2217436.1 hypothetical protein EV179_000586 [Coemansia sp. RSA 487]KAJ2572665.1 hypothetical protein IW140_000780 [Coemansia sp. RSA 1813]
MKWRIALGAALAIAVSILAAEYDEEAKVSFVRGLNLAVAPVPNGLQQLPLQAAIAAGHPVGDQPAHDNGSHGNAGGSNNNNSGGGVRAQQPPGKEGERAQQGQPPQHNQQQQQQQQQQQHGEPAAKHEPAGNKDHKEDKDGGKNGGAADKKGGKDSSKHGDDKKEPTKTHKGSSRSKKDDESDDEADDDDESEKEYLKRVKADKDAGRMPGRMKMLVPPRTVHTPLFELDSVVELQWEYDNNVIEVPEKLMISVQLPKDPHAAPGTKPMLYDIAVNITGEQKKFYWDTKNDVPEGEGMREGSGYTMYFYDGDIGFKMSDVVPAGYLIKYAMPFAFYISRYERTNDGVPRNYNPNSATRHGPALGAAAVCYLAAMALTQLL